ncbi:hypothetical protein ABW21_db0202435 [Orbilia brochopaga]|nr:hypothetical protein ABW21_db0202435 [Drechslerella brochopaga]
MATSLLIPRIAHEMAAAAAKTVLASTAMRARYNELVSCEPKSDLGLVEKFRTAPVGPDADKPAEKAAFKVVTMDIACTIDLLLIAVGHILGIPSACTSTNMG